MRYYETSTIFGAIRLAGSWCAGADKRERNPTVCPRRVGVIKYYPSPHLSSGPWRRFDSRSLDFCVYPRYLAWFFFLAWILRRAMARRVLVSRGDKTGVVRGERDDCCSHERETTNGFWWWPSLLGVRLLGVVVLHRWFWSVGEEEVGGFFLITRCREFERRYYSVRRGRAEVKGWIKDGGGIHKVGEEAAATSNIRPTSPFFRVLTIACTEKSINERSSVLRPRAPTSGARQ